MKNFYPIIFYGDNVSIIPDEETFELKININDEEDKFIYQVGDGITSLLIIIYTIFMERKNKNKTKRMKNNKIKVTIEVKEN